MLAKKSIYLPMVMLALLFGCSDMGKSPCKTKEACMNDAKCRCWCSVKCGYRQKTEADNPMYVEKDANGKFCYCKQWDLDNYKNNCEMNMKIPQPQGAQ